jgi:cardiolipin synthase A/B
VSEIFEQLLLWVDLIEAEFVAAAAVIVPAFVSYHIIKSKNDVRAAIGWTGLVWLVPLVGPVLYFLFGINRIQRKALRVRRERDEAKELLSPPLLGTIGVSGQVMGDAAAGKGVLAHGRLMDSIGRFHLSQGNVIEPLAGGDAAYGEMLGAITAAKRTIALASYLLGNDEIGERFVKALSGAAARGVEVCVLIDGMDRFHHWPTKTRMLRSAGVAVERFNYSFWPWRMGYLNLRNHRKILVVDGITAFTGGMNIGAENLASAPAKDAIRDIHFKLEGGIVEQLMTIFAEDWVFSTGKTLKGPSWFPDSAVAADPGNIVARGIPDGPDEDLDKMSWALVSALGMARERVDIVTPYFLPDRILLSALNYAALRGVSVNIFLPEKGNYRLVDWASRAQFDQLLEGGCRLHLVAAPFNHSKLMVVDDFWTLFGSTNWDPRSLRLNFEFNVECFNTEFATRVKACIREITADARALTTDELSRTRWYYRLRNGAAWLLSPYL